MTAHPPRPRRAPESVDAVTADDVLLDRLAARATHEDDRSDELVRSLAALAADVDRAGDLPAGAAGDVATRRVLPAAVHLVPARPARRRHRPAAVAGVAVSALLVGGMGTAAAVTGDPWAGLERARTVVADVTGADWLRPAKAHAGAPAETSPTAARTDVVATRAAGAPGAAGAGAADGGRDVPRGLLEARQRAEQVLAEVAARLAAGDVAAAEAGLQRAQEVVQGMPEQERARWQRELVEAGAAVAEVREEQARRSAADASTHVDDGDDDGDRAGQAEDAGDPAAKQPAGQRPSPRPSDPGGQGSTERSGNGSGGVHGTSRDG